MTVMDGALPIVLLVSVGFLVNLLLEGSLVSLFLRRLGKRTPHGGLAGKT